MCNCGGAADHEHGLDEAASSLCSSLHAFIDMANSSVLNASRDSAPLAQVLRSRYHRTLADGPGHLASDTDPQLLVKIQ